MKDLIPVKFNEEVVITTKVLANVYGCDNKIISNNFNRNKDKFEEGKHYYELKGKQLQAFKGCHQNDKSLKYVSTLYLWTKLGSLQHFNTLTNKKGLSEIKDYFHIDEENIFILSSRKEIEFINQLEEALEPFNIKGIRQFSILSYRIDYYIPSLKVAIEYDENDHKNYSYEAHEGRQQEIEKKLGYRFIRVSDKNTNSYNIGFVIKNIFNI
jgi:very-short-patch-repair endonuclease